MANTSNTSANESTPVTIRPYASTDRPGVRRIYGNDIYARPTLGGRFPLYNEYLADSMSYYTDCEPESAFVAAAGNTVVGALLGALDTERCERLTREHIRPLVRRRCLTGVYGWPGWLIYDLITEIAGMRTTVPEVDLNQYPAHLHIGLLEDWQHGGIGTRLMAQYAAYLRSHNVPGYHLSASTHNWKGMAFYRKLGLEVLGQFNWKLHDGVKLRTVTETIFGQQLE